MSASSMFYLYDLLPDNYYILKSIVWLSWILIIFLAIMSYKWLRGQIDKDRIALDVNRIFLQHKDEVISAISILRKFKNIDPVEFLNRLDNLELQLNKIDTINENLKILIGAARKSARVEIEMDEG